MSMCEQAFENWQVAGHCAEEKQAMYNEMPQLTETDIKSISDLFWEQKQAEEKIKQIKQKIDEYTNNLIDDPYLSQGGELNGAGIRIFLTKPSVKDRKYFFEAREKLKKELAMIEEEEKEFLEYGLVSFKSSPRVSIKLAK